MRTTYVGFIVECEAKISKESRIPFMRCKLNSGAILCLTNDQYQHTSDIISTYEKAYELPPNAGFEERTKNLMRCHVPLQIVFRMEKGKGEEDTVYASHRICPFEEG